MAENKSTIFICTIIVFTFCVGYYLNEDSLGGAKNDYLYHVKYLKGFTDQFVLTYNEFGLNQEDKNVRNSPLFYIFASMFLKIGLPIKSLKLVNLISTILILFFFYQCLVLKYKNQVDQSTYILLSFTLLLSPTIRSLTFWPYPFLWALCFFLISIYFYLYQQRKKQLKYAYFNVLFLALSAYFTPNFAVFSIFYLFRYSQIYGLKKELFSIILLNLLLSIPALYFLITKNFYLFNSNVYAMDNYLKYNISNKIIIITSFLFLFFLPFIKLKDLLKKINFKLNNKFFIISFFALLNMFYFNFTSGAGGGIFFHFSQKFGGNYFLFSIFMTSIYIFYTQKLFNYNNLLLYSLLVIYNLQFTIYYKYFDPLIIFIFIFLTQFEKLLDLKDLTIKYLYLYSIFLSLNLGKEFINY